MPVFHSQPVTWAYLLASHADLKGASERLAKIVRHCKQQPGLPPPIDYVIEAQEVHAVRLCFRPEGKRLLRALRPGDSLIVATTAELGGTAKQISQTLRDLLVQRLSVHLLDAADAPLQCGDYGEVAAVVEALQPAIIRAAEQNRRRSIRNTLAERKTERLPLGPRCPLGFRVVRRRGVARVVRDWAFERWASRICRWQGEGASLVEIHRRLQRCRARGPEGRPWSYWSVVRACRWQKQRQTVGETVPRSAAT